MKNKTVLLVDDDPVFVETTRIALENDFNIITACDGDECMERIEKEMPDLILLDVMMKHLGEGVDISEKLKKAEKTKNIPVIMLTGVSKIYDMSTITDQSTYNHSDLWLEKPVDSEKLLEDVKRLIR